MTETTLDDLNERRELNPQILREALLIKSARAATGVGLGSTSKIDPEAESWVFGKQEGPFSFDVCCRELGVNPDEMRDWLNWYKTRYHKSK